MSSLEKPSTKQNTAKALRKLGNDVADTGRGIFDAFKKAKPEAQAAVAAGVLIGATLLLNANKEIKIKDEDIGKPAEDKKISHNTQSRSKLKNEVGPPPKNSPTSKPEQAQSKPESTTEPAGRDVEIISGRIYLVRKDHEVVKELPPALYKEIMGKIPAGIRGTPAAIVKAAELCRQYFIIGAYCGEWVRIVYELAGVNYKKKKKMFDSMPDYTRYDANGKMVRNPDCGIHHLIPQKTREYIKLGHNPDVARSMALKFAQREFKVGSHVITCNGSPDLWGAHAEIITRVIDPKNFLYEVMGYPGGGKQPYIIKKYLGPNPNKGYARVVRFYNVKKTKETDANA